MTDDAKIAEILKSCRDHGTGATRYDNIRLGFNGRLDTFQAAILLEKLPLFPGELEARDKVANRYSQALESVVDVPLLPSYLRSAWAQYTIIADRRDELAAWLKDRDIPTMVYYPKLIHQQEAFKHYPSSPTGIKASEKLMQQALSLPMHPYLEKETQQYIIESILDFYAHHKA